MSHESTRKIEAELFRGLQGIGQIKAAEVLGVSEGTVSKMKSNDTCGETKITFHKIAELVASMGLKIVSADQRCVDPETFKMLWIGHQKWTESINNSEQLLFDDPE